MADDTDDPQPFGSYGVPPSRDVDRARWLSWRSRVWGDSFKTMAKTLDGLGEELVSERLGYEHDVCVAAALDGLLTALLNAKGFYVSEAWQTGQEGARDLLAGLQAEMEAPGIAEALERFLGNPGGSG